MTPEEILKHTRQLIEEHGGGDPDKWWYANRFVFARLHWDERKTKTDIKRRLFEANGPCHYCKKPFDTKQNVHLHRLDGSKGYCDENCVLMHPECHQKYHAEHQQEKEQEIMGRQITPTKWSKRYHGKPFMYWWDISPGMADALGDFNIEFAKKDTKERCVVSPEDLKKFLIPERQTTRGTGHWGVKVLKDRQDKLAFEPGTGKAGEYLFLDVEWINAEED